MRPRLLLTALGALFCLCSLSAFGQAVSDYQFFVGTGTPTDMSTGATQIINNAVDDGSSGIRDIGFTFRFANVDYTQFSVSSNGAMRLGPTAVTTAFGNSLTSSLPMTNAFYEDMHTGVYDGNGYVKMKVTGSAPSRVLTIEWRARAYSSNLGTAAEIFNWQTRLYEGTNIIEYLYMTMRSDLNTSASIGIANSATANDYISVTPGTPPTISRTAINNSANISGAGALPANTRFTFAPCNANIRVAGNVAQGGTVNMAGGDTLLRDLSILRGSAIGATPLTINLPSPACAARGYTYTIGGPNMGDYTISPANGTLNDGGSATPTITFRPTGTGVREATLTVADNLGFSRTYTLRARGLTRIAWSGNLGQGGTANVMSGDTLLNGSKVTYGTSKTFTPLVLQNINNDPLASPPAAITYTLNDPTGNYSISPTSVALNGGLQSAVEITFNATGDVGYQEATLTVNAEGEIRTYLLRAFNAAPGGELYAGGMRITRGTPLFVDRTGCVGVDIISIPVEAVNTGAGNLVVRGGDIYANDTVIGQGPYQVLRDHTGQPVKSMDYFFTNSPGVLPKKNNASFDSLVIPEGERRTFYLNFIPTRSGKRFATAYINTNAFNTSDPNVNGTSTRGILQAPLFGRGEGGYLSGAEAGKRPAGLTLQATDVRETSTVTAWISNSGECDLRIARGDFRFQTGDVNEFALVSVLPNTTVSGDYYVLAPGEKDSVVIRFSPQTYGSRRATIRLATNDSTLGAEIGNESGAFYWDVFGVGRVGLEARGVRLNPAVIGGEGSRGFILLENTSGGVAEVESINLTGGSGEITEDPSQPWPPRPLRLSPGEKVRLWVTLNTGANATPGERSAEVVIGLKGGAEARAVVKGYAGTREISVLPASLFANAKVKVGDVARQYVSITNIGTLPLQLNDPVLVETNAGDYRVSPLLRRILEPGQTELVEVTYTPQGSGVSSGTLTILSNGTNGSQVVTLGGEGTGTQIGLPGSSTGTVRGNDDPARNNAGKRGNIQALEVLGILPNPARDLVRINYAVGQEGAVQVELYDPSGRRVLAMDQGTRRAGEHSAEMNVGELSSGTYRCLVRQGERTISQAVYVVK